MAWTPAMHVYRLVKATFDGVDIPQCLQHVESCGQQGNLCIVYACEKLGDEKLETTGNLVLTLLQFDGHQRIEDKGVWFYAGYVERTGNKASIAHRFKRHVLKCNPNGWPSTPFRADGIPVFAPDMTGIKPPNDFQCWKIYKPDPRDATE